MNTFFNDLKFAFRMLRKKSGFTAIALITLAIGIGANTTMFSLVNALLFRPIHVQEPDQLVHCGIRNFGLITYSTYVDVRDDNPVFSHLVAHNHGFTRATCVQEDTVRQVTPMYVSANYFPALGIRPAYGRTFLPQEEHYGAEPVVVMSYQTWQRQGADPEMVGRYVSTPRCARSSAWHRRNSQVQRLSGPISGCPWEPMVWSTAITRIGPPEGKGPYGKSR